MIGLSFEFFPPRSERGERTLHDAAVELANYGPSYFSVTFGAGGSTREGTSVALNDLGARLAVPTAAHLCFSGLSRDEVVDYAEALWTSGHRRIVALRGDADDLETSAFSSVAELVATLRGLHLFDIAVACYPEVHPKAASPEADLDVLLSKQEAGASHAITQFFFDNDVFDAFVTRARRAGVTIPIVPGLLPIYDLDRAVSFGESCGSQVPAWVRREIGGADDPTAAARALIERQAAELAEGGVRDLHVYTLNRAPLAAAAALAFRRGGRDEHQTRLAA